MENMDSFVELQRQVVAAGLMQRRPLLFFLRAALTLLLFLVGIMALFVSTSLWLHILLAVFFAFLYGQIGLLGHDAGHRQVVRALWVNDCIGYVCGAGVGISFTSWLAIHNAHHASPNRDDSDPDIQFPFLAYSAAQVEKRTNRMARRIIRYQAWLYIPFLMFTALSIRRTGVAHFLTRALRETWIDQVLFWGHFVLYFGLLFAVLPWMHAILFIGVHQLLWGLYFGSIFAPNHKGMPVLDKLTKVDFVREQVLTARNIRGNVLTDMWYGGLNYQIEHHLFPAMPRSNLRHAQGIVKKFCAAHSIPYHETGVLRSYVEILSYMRDIGRLAAVPA